MAFLAGIFWFVVKWGLIVGFVTLILAWTGYTPSGSKHR